MDQWPKQMGVPAMGRFEYSNHGIRCLGAEPMSSFCLKSSSAVFLSTKRMRVKQLRMACMRSPPLSPSSQSLLPYICWSMAFQSGPDSMASASRASPLAFSSVQSG